MPARLAFVALLLAAASSFGSEPVEPRAPAVAPFGVQHGASYLPGRLAPGTIFVVKGAWLGPEEVVAAGAPYPLELAESRIELRSLATGEVFPVPLLHAWTFQLGGMIPLDVPPGPAELTAIYQGRRSEPREAMVSEAAGALFTLSWQGSGRAVAQGWESPESTPLIELARPARPGQTIILWATGLNNADGRRQVRVLLSNRSTASSANRWFDTAGFASVELTPFYAGPAPGLPGVDQVNLTLPTEGLPEGCLVQVSLSVDNHSIGSPTIAIASGDGPCVHPWGLSESQLRDLDEGGQVRTASLFLTDAELPTLNSAEVVRHVNAWARTLLVSADGLQGLTGSRAPFGNGLFGCAGSLGFAVGSIIGGPYEPLPQPPPPARLPQEFGDAGDSLQLLGPDGQRLPMPLQALGGPYAPLDSYAVEGNLEPGAFTPGTWTVLAPGGEDIEAFEGSVLVPPMPAIAPPERIRRDEDLHVGWNGLSLEDSTTVQIRVAVRNPDNGGLEGVSCFARGGFGGIRISKENLARLPASPDGFANFSVVVGSSVDFDSPALAHGDAYFSATRTSRVPID